jgi:hypothetical protein
MVGETARPGIETGAVGAEIGTKIGPTEAAAGARFRST